MAEQRLLTQESLLAAQAEVKTSDIFGRIAVFAAKRR